MLIAGSCAAEGVTDGRNGFLIEENAVSLCAKLTALCADREAMLRVGENAMRELYLSWEDAVARANERYAVVLDRYRSGKYPKHERFSDEFFNTQGDLMEAMSRVAEMRGETGRLRRELREGFDEAREALREKLEKEWEAAFADRKRTDTNEEKENMKEIRVLLLNGSPRANGNTALALREMEKVFAQNGVQTETVLLGIQAIRGCTA